MTVVKTDEKQPDRICGLCVIKVINGEERGYFQRMADPESDREELRTILGKFDEFTGYLPLVGHGLAGKKLQALKDAYGVLLGKPFSNQVIDTEKMGRIHLPEIEDGSLGSYVQRLGIECRAETEMEKECRLIWKLYCRLERSELENTRKNSIRMLPLEYLCDSKQISPTAFRWCLDRDILLLGDLTDYSEKDILNMENGYRMLRLLKELLDSYGLTFSETDYEAPSVYFNLTSNESEAFS